MKEGAVKGESERVTPGDIFAGLQHVTQKGSDKKPSERLVGFFCRVIGSLKQILGCPFARLQH
jgi:hypothetical protein